MTVLIVTLATMALRRRCCDASVSNESSSKTRNFDDRPQLMQQCFRIIRKAWMHIIIIWTFEACIIICNNTIMRCSRSANLNIASTVAMTSVRDYEVSTCVNHSRKPCRCKTAAQGVLTHTFHFLSFFSSTSIPTDLLLACGCFWNTWGSGSLRELPELLTAVL